MVTGLVHFVAFLKTKSYSDFIYYIRSSWTMEMDLKQLSRGLHGINRALPKKQQHFLRELNAFQDKTKAKTRKWNVPPFVSNTTCFAVVFWFVVVSFFFSLNDHTALRDWLHNMSTLPLDMKVLRHAQQLEHLLRKLHLLTSSQAEQSTQKVPFCILQAPA